MQYIIAQVIGGIGLICSMLSFQQKDRKRLMIFQMAAYLFSSLHLFGVGAVTGGCLDFISVIRIVIFSQNDKKKWAASPAWLFGFCALMICVGIASWDNILSIFSIIGSVLSTIALWMKSGSKVRKISLFVGPCYFIYDILNGAITGAMTQALAVLSIIIGMVRYDRKKVQS